MRLLPILLLLTGCSGETAAPPPAPAPPLAAAPVKEPALSVAAQGVNAFAIDLYSRLKVQPGNLAWSPASVAMALTMTWGGARGQTALEMARVLRLNGSPAEAMAASGEQLRALIEPREGVTLAVANRLFGDREYTFQPAFLDATAAHFGAPLEPVDFRGDPEAGRARINAWVAEQTRDHIQELVPERAVDKTTRLALVNAIYLLAEWASPFEKERTRPAPFYVDGATPADVPTMNQAGYFRYGATDGLKVLELGYKDGKLAMGFLLPDARDGLAALEERLDAEALAGWLGAASSQRVIVHLPRFRVEPGEPVALAGPLQDAGMKLAFQRLVADFTGIADPPNPEQRLFISAVLHKAFVAVDEQGTEAAAATAVLMAEGGSAPSASPPEFTADHPFLFVLRDRESGMILFMGRVTDPR